MSSLVPAQHKHCWCLLQIAGMALEALKQPVINGYFIAGSLVGPGGAGLIKVSHVLPGLPNQQQRTLIKIRVEDFMWVCRGVSSEQWRSIPLPGALRHSNKHI